MNEQLISVINNMNESKRNSNLLIDKILFREEYSLEEMLEKLVEVVNENRKKEDELFSQIKLTLKKAKKDM